MKNKATFSIGFNFSDDLVEHIVALNKINDRRKISEVFGALPDSPLNSARPSNRIPKTNWTKFQKQVNMLLENNVYFNYLFNTQQQLTEDLKDKLSLFLENLLSIGVGNVTVGTFELARFIRASFPVFNQTLSLTYGIKSVRQLSEIENNLFNSIYLDGAFVNRDFRKIKQFVNESCCEIRLYANLSCISNCPVIKQHYGLFSKPFDENTARDNDNFFKGCSLVKLSNPIEYIQMPWIRPEDIQTYVEEGVTHFKLSDRLSTTEVLVRIGKAYISEKSTNNLFDIIERNGDKYKYFNLEDAPNNIIKLYNNKIPSDFIEHFRNGNCQSKDLSCRYCKAIADDAVSITNVNAPNLLKNESKDIHDKLLKRVNTSHKSTNILQTATS